MRKATEIFHPRQWSALVITHNYIVMFGKAHEDSDYTRTLAGGTSFVVVVVVVVVAVLVIIICAFTH